MVCKAPRWYLLVYSRGGGVGRAALAGAPIPAATAWGERSSPRRRAVLFTAPGRAGTFLSYRTGPLLE